MRFEYHEPATISECLDLLAHYGPDASILAGGTDLVVRLRLREVRPGAVISIAGLETLRQINIKDDGGLEIGAATTLREIEHSPLLANGFDLIRQGASQVSSMQVRNVATLGGNSCNASPSADTVPGLIAAEAEAIIVSPVGERRLPLEKFFKGQGSTDLQTGEMLRGFHLPAPPPRTAGVYMKYALRGTVDLAIVGVAARLTLDEHHRIEQARISLGAVGPVPLRARNAETLLLGRDPDEELFREAALVAAEESRPISDARASAQYRKEMVGVWTRSVLHESFHRARADGLTAHGGDDF